MAVNDETNRTPTSEETLQSWDKGDQNYATTGELPAVLVAPGDVLAGKYEVEEVIGRGGMGIVVAARHIHLNERVALKLLLPSATQTQEFRERFMREAQVTAKLRSEHIARVTDVGILDNGSPYMIMEYLQGRDLRQILTQEGPLPVALAVEWIVQACEGMAEAHSYGVVHRDLKPSNLFLTTRRDGSDLLKVLDFGISKAILREDVESRDLTSSGTLLGSPRYMSPEQLHDTALVDSRADVWSLATILYEMLAGRPPFAERTHAATCVRVLGTDPPASLVELRPEIPEALQNAILGALARDPAQRTPDVAAFAASLLQATSDIVAPAVEVSVARIQGMVDATGKARTNASSGPNALPSLRATIGSGDSSARTGRTPGAWSDGGAARRSGGTWWKAAAGAVVILLLFAVYQLWLRPTTTQTAAIDPVASSMTGSTSTGSSIATAPDRSSVTSEAKAPEAGARNDAAADAEDAAAKGTARPDPPAVPKGPRPVPKPQPTAPTPTKNPVKPGDILESRQ